MQNSNFKKWFLVLLLAVGGGTIFKSMYLREVFYYPWNEFMGVDNTQSGILMSWLGLVGIIAGAIAGVIVDKINNTRLVITASYIVIGLATLWQSTAPSLSVQYLVIAILSFTANGFFLVSMVRAVRLVGSSDDQGKLFGFLESGRGIAGSIISAIAVVIFSMAASAAEGGQTVSFPLPFSGPYYTSFWPRPPVTQTQTGLALRCGLYYYKGNIPRRSHFPPDAHSSGGTV